ncbi:MAG: class I SAM-dependent methyltransferase [Pseudomonadota bacterium]
MSELDKAYALRTPQDSVKLYGDWAETYDTDFVAAMGYVYHENVAKAFHDVGGTGPVLDVGAGTGLVGQAVREALPDLDVDAIDISAEMLGVAREKNIYRALFEADLTKPLELPDAAYSGIVSAGTFTHGHVGPVCLPELMRIARPGAVFVLSIKGDVFDQAGFGSAFAALTADGVITPVDFTRVRIYGDEDHDHAQDTGLLAIFRHR